MANTWITPDMADSVGRDYLVRVSFPITESDIRRWAIAVYYPEPPPRLYWDREYAATTVHGGIVSPEEFNPFAWMTADGPPPAAAATIDVSSAGPEGVLGIAPPTTANMLNGGMECAYGEARMRPGDVIRSITRLVEYREREGRLGRMLFTVTEQRWTNQEDQLVKAQRNISIRY